MSSRTENVAIDQRMNQPLELTLPASQTTATMYQHELVGKDSNGKVTRCGTGITLFEGVTADGTDAASKLKIIRRGVFKAVVDSSVANCDARRGFRLLSGGSSPTLVVATHRHAKVWATGGVELDIAPSAPANAALAGYILWIDATGGDGSGECYVLLDADYAKSLADGDTDTPPTTLAATGTQQSDAAAIVHSNTFVTAADAAKGVVLPSAVAGALYRVYNTAAAALLLYPNTSDDINDGTADVAVTVPPKSMATCFAMDTTTWAVDITTLPNLPVTLAATGTVQGDAASIVAIETFVTAADGTKGVVLPAAVVGDRRRVYNTGTSELKVYPATGDDINDGTTNAAILLGPKDAAEFVALDGTTWVYMQRVDTGTAQTISGAKTLTGDFAQGSNGTDRVTIKGIYMTPANVAVAVPSITDPDIARVAVDVSSAFAIQPAVGDAVIAIPQEALPTNARLQGAFVSNTDEIEICFGSEGGNVTGANKNFKFLVLDLT